MEFTKETKERFVKMLEDRQIIVIRCSIPNRKKFVYKIIGANNDGKWDFTPLISDYTYPTATPVIDKTISASDGISVICEALKKLAEENICINLPEKDEMYFEVRELLTFFYI